MKYHLMHKDIIVAQITIDEDTMVISKINDIYDFKHAPIIAQTKDGCLNRAQLNEWWLGRSIPASRDGIKSDLNTLDLSSARGLINKVYALSLSDQYWVKPQNLNISWSQINFYENEFSEDIGDLLIGENKKVLDFASPDNTSDGWLRKRWKIIDDKRCLIKSGSGAIMQEPYNEVLASEINRRINSDYVAYKMLNKSNAVYSICENFTNKDTELISAWQIDHSLKKRGRISPYQHYINCYKELGCPEIEDSINKMIVLDYIIANTDRHMNNFGVIRNANTLEIIKAAPIFDNGTSLWNGQATALIHPIMNISCKPFKECHEDQLKLVTSFDFLQKEALIGMGDFFKEITRNSIFVDEKRADTISFSLDKRIDKLFELIPQKNIYPQSVNFFIEKAKEAKELNKLHMDSQPMQCKTKKPSNYDDI